MGEVFLAEQKSIKTRVAIKTLLPHISADGDCVQRFFNEAIAVSRSARRHRQDLRRRLPAVRASVPRHGVSRGRDPHATDPALGAALARPARRHRAPDRERARGDPPGRHHAPRSQARQRVPRARRRARVRRARRRSSTSGSRSCSGASIARPSVGTMGTPDVHGARAVARLADGRLAHGRVRAGLPRVRDGDRPRAVPRGHDRRGVCEAPEDAAALAPRARPGVAGGARCHRVPAAPQAARGSTGDDGGESPRRSPRSVQVSRPCSRRHPTDGTVAPRALHDRDRRRRADPDRAHRARHVSRPRVACCSRCSRRSAWRWSRSWSRSCRSTSTARSRSSSRRSHRRRCRAHHRRRRFLASRLRSTLGTAAVATTGGATPTECHPSQGHARRRGRTSADQSLCRGPIASASHDAAAPAATSLHLSPRPRSRRRSRRQYVAV